MKYTYVFVVLVYRNTKDLEDFFVNFNIPNSKVIVVNSYYDEITRQEFENIALSNNAEFINVENRGYGAGNNAGIQFAIDNYAFEFLVISNADVIIQKMNNCDVNINVINAPNIITLYGKRQNPIIPYNVRILEKWKYFAYTQDYYSVLYVCIAINKLLRYLFLILNHIGCSKKIYCPHGAFIIIPSKIIEHLHPIFDEKMFLFGEEGVLAYKAEKEGIKIEYNRNVMIRHKEDGSISTISNNKVRSNLKESYIHLYETYMVRQKTEKKLKNKLRSLDIPN